MTIFDIMTKLFPKDGKVGAVAGLEISGDSWGIFPESRKGSDYGRTKTTQLVWKTEKVLFVSGLAGCSTLVLCVKLLCGIFLKLEFSRE